MSEFAKMRIKQLQIRAREIRRMIRTEVNLVDQIAKVEREITKYQVKSYSNGLTAEEQKHIFELMGQSSELHYKNTKRKFNPGEDLIKHFELLKELSDTEAQIIKLSRAGRE